jgi:hypothetical protein
MLFVFLTEHPVLLLYIVFHGKFLTLYPINLSWSPNISKSYLIKCVQNMQLTTQKYSDLTDLCHHQYWVTDTFLAFLKHFILSSLQFIYLCIIMSIISYQSLKKEFWVSLSSYFSALIFCSEGLCVDSEISIGTVVESREDWAQHGLWEPNGSPLLWPLQQNVSCIWWNSCTWLFVGPPL